MKIENPVSSMEITAMLTPYGVAHNKRHFMVDCICSPDKIEKNSLVCITKNDREISETIPTTSLIICDYDIAKKLAASPKNDTMFIVCKNPTDAYYAYLFMLSD
jgi:hypothetical protein